MKRLVMTIALATMFLTFGTFNVNAQVPPQKATTQQQQQEEFKTIKNNEIPSKVKDAVMKDYDVEKIEAAYVNQDKSKYKLDLKLKEDEMEENEQNTMGENTKTVVYNKDGEEVKNPKK